MPSTALIETGSPAARELSAKLTAFGDSPLSIAARTAALERFASLRSGRERPGRFWRVDFETIAPEASAIDPDAARVTVENPGERVAVRELAVAAREASEIFARAFGTTGAAKTKFGSLAAAFARRGVFVHVRADQACDEPIVIRYSAPAGAAIFPYTVIYAERGARATVIERIESGAGAFLCGATEIVTEENASVTCAALQSAHADAQVIWTRAARPGRDAEITWADAELGGGLAAGDLGVTFEQPGSEAFIASLFFPRGNAHVDVVSTVDHRAGEATSETIVKSAARERGQARFLGNIRIAPHAQGSDARLRDDALLLSKSAHIDSVPALEIGANDVKAYHGATVGAIDEDQIFYMESRGIERPAAEQMIALGFFEPAIERFPSAALRDDIRALLAEKLV